MALRFGCGEFVPGGEPIYVPPLPVPTPPILIPDPKPPIIIIPPFIPNKPKPRDIIPPRPEGPFPGKGRPGEGGGGTRGPITGQPFGPITGGVIGPITGGTGTSTGGPRGPTTGGPTRGQPDPQLPLEPIGQPLGGVVGEPQLPGGTTGGGTTGQPQPGIIRPELIVNEINIENEIILNPGELNENNPSEIYDNTLNFFETTPLQSGSTQEFNSTYPRVFNTRVTRSVNELLKAEGSTAHWSEPTLFQITTEDVKKSLQPSLLRAFNLIHYPGGQLVGEDAFLNVIIHHLRTGTMSEFDPDYYLQASYRQENDKRIRYTGLANSDKAERAGLGVIAAGAIVVDSEQQANLRKRQIRRQRRLNTDIKANIDVEPLSSACDQLFLTDAGITVTTLSGSNVSVPTGDGDGYYIAMNVTSMECIPLQTSSDYTRTYFVPPEVRYNALTLFRESPKVTLKASSLEGSHEFVSGSQGPFELRPLYLTLNLDSIAQTQNRNPLVSRYGATYSIEDNQSIINEHTANNGLAVTRVNIDYRDPLYQYILESSSVYLEMNDINFKSIEDSKDYKGGSVLARNIPFGLIITPVMGSKFNPFYGFSQIESVSDRVVRYNTFGPDISLSEKDNPRPQLREANLYNEESGALRIGVAEPLDSQNVVHKYEASNPLYTETFYVNGKYTTSTTPVSSYGLSYLVKDVIDYLVDTYNPDKLYWFDVVRRMPINRVGELLYSNDLRFISSLERGERNCVPIYSVIKSVKNQTVNMLQDDDKVVIKAKDR